VIAFGLLLGRQLLDRFGRLLRHDRPLFGLRARRLGKRFVDRPAGQNFHARNLRRRWRFFLGKSVITDKDQQDGRNQLETGSA
jgi:hypothetical protein